MKKEIRVSNFVCAEHKGVEPVVLVECPKCKKPKTIGYFIVEDKLRFLTGKILTLVDAVHQDVTQRDAFKDVIKQEFSSVINSLYKISSGPMDKKTDTDCSWG